MQVIVTGKHFDITDLIKSQIEDAFAGVFDEKTVKVSTIRVMVEFNAPRFTLEAIVGLKSNELTTKVVGTDLYHVLHEATDHIKVQLDKYLGKARQHSHESLRDLELEKAEEESNQ